MDASQAGGGLDALDSVVLEVWIPVAAPNVCAGCVFLGTIGPMAADVGPRPPLHPGCRCRRQRLDLSVLTPWEKIRIALMADRNRRAAKEITRQALSLVGIGSGRVSRRR